MPSAETDVLGTVAVAMNNLLNIFVDGENQQASGERPSAHKRKCKFTFTFVSSIILPSDIRKAMANKTLAPQQARSRESMRKLLKAAAEVLGQHGLEGTTIPRIAQHAGLTPGAVYRRFPDKDALLEAVVIGILERQELRLRMALTPDMVRQIPLAVFAEQLVSSMLVSYRANAGLLRALRQFSQGRFYTPFCKRAAKLEMRSIQHL